MIDWIDCLSVGVPELDEDHKALIGLVNQYADAVAKQNTLEIHEVFRELENYTNYHFRHEEDLMEQCGFAGLADHRKQHEALTAKLKAYQEEVLWGSMAGDEAEIRTFLQSWLFCHVMREDYLYSEALQKISPA